MKPLLRTVLAACILVAAQSQASAGEWPFIAETNELTISSKAGSYATDTTKGGAPIGVITAQIREKKGGQYHYGQFYVAHADCDRGMGKVVVLDTSGKYLNEKDFVLKGDSVSSRIGGLICALYWLDENEKRSKER